MTKQVYVQAPSKAAINARLAIEPHAFEAIEYSPYGSKVYDLESLPDGTLVKVFERYVGGSPYAKAYGTVKRDKAGKVRIK